MSTFDFDVIVIGGGSGGYAAARKSAAGGLRVAVIDGADELGGLCILRGCMPTKALLHAAEVLHSARRAAVWGIKVPQAGFDLAAVMERKDRMIREFAEYRQKQLQDGRFKLFRAFARFEVPHTLALSTGEKLTSAYFIVATGSIVSPSPVPALDEVGFITSDDALKLRKLPESMIVLGGGAVSVEFAQIFARFDVKVTMIQRSGQLLHDFDLDSVKALEKVLQDEGITVICETQIVGARREGNRKVISFRHEGAIHEVSAEEIFYGLGRVANTKSLDLARAGVTCDAGRIKANAAMETSLPHIFACGDCTGPYDIVHIAIQQGETAAHNILYPERPKLIDYRVLISVVFTEPQLATVGLTEKNAAATGVPHLTACYPFNDHGKSMLMDAQNGFVKLIAHSETGEILGGSVVGPLGGELIHEIAVAVQKRMTVHELMEMPHYHPTLAEIWTYPAEDLAEKIGLRE